MPSILFVCTANRFRSPLAAALLKKHLEELGMMQAWHISSAGTWAVSGQPALPSVIAAAQRFNIDLTDHRSIRVSKRLLSEYDHILVMQSGQKEALACEFPQLKDHIYLLSDVVERRTYDISDSLTSEEETAEVAAELDSLLRRGLDYMCVLATYLHNVRVQSKG